MNDAVGERTEVPTVAALTWQRSTSEAAVTAVVTLISSLLVFGPILGMFTAPWGGGDMTQIYLQNSLWEGWKYGFTTQYGFPYGMEANAFAGLDILPNVFAHTVNSLTGNAFIGMNLLLFLSFPITAMLTYVAIRLVGLSGPLAIALAVTFTFIPFHFGRGLGHAYLALLISLVTGVILALLVGSGRIHEWADEPSRRLRIGRLLVLGALLIVTAWSSLYYAVFGMILLAAAVIWRISHGDGLRRLARSAGPLLALLALAVIGLIPVMMSRASTAGADTLGLRDPLESVKYAGNLAIALVPQPYDQFFPAYNDFVNEMFTGMPGEESHLMANFGTWVTSACLVVMLVGLVTQSRRRALGRTVGSMTERDTPAYAPITYVAFLLITTLLFFIPWGLNYFVASLATAQIRGWNRLVTLLLLFFILGAAAALREWRWPARPRTSVVVALVIVAITVVEAVLPWRNIYSQVAESGRQKIDSALAYATDVNRAVPGNCGLLTLPLMFYPGDGPRAPSMDDYDHALIGMTNPNKSLSYGAIRDTPDGQWQNEFAGAPSPTQVDTLLSMGFCGIHLDTAGFENAEEISTQLTSQFGPPEAVSPDGRWRLFALHS